MKFPIPAFIFLGLFVVASLVQLVFAFLEKENLRRKEKFVCLLMLSLFAFFAFPNKPLIYVGALLGMIGDILDLQPKTFVLGVVCFYLGHLCYIFEAIWDIFNFNIPYYIYIVLVLTYIVIYIIIYQIVRRNKNHSMIDKVGQSLYFSIQVTYLPIFIYTLIHFSNLMWLAIIGALLFITSDTILVKTHYGRKFKRYHFYIMGTYLLAELFIVLGFVLSFVY